MNFKTSLKNKLEAYFDISKKPVEYSSITFDFIAKYNQRSAKYLLVKELEYYAFENNEYILYKKIDPSFNYNSLKHMLKQNVSNIISIDQEHMSSTISFILEIDFPLDSEKIKTIEKFKFYKSFLFGLKGWVNARLIVINPAENKGFANKLGKKELPKYLKKPN